MMPPEFRLAVYVLNQFVDYSGILNDSYIHRAYWKMQRR